MLASFFQIFSTRPAAPSDPEARGAFAALLVRIARADGVYGDKEARKVEDVLSARFGLSETMAAALRAQGEHLEAAATDTVQFTRALKVAVPEAERLPLLQALWSVALADGEREDHEDAAIRLIARLLGVTDRDSALMRQKALAR